MYQKMHVNKHLDQISNRVPHLRFKLSSNKNEEDGDLKAHQVIFFHLQFDTDAKYSTSQKNVKLKAIFLKRRGKGGHAPNIEGERGRA
jgi:hypothetical protein